MSPRTYINELSPDTKIKLGVFVSAMVLIVPAVWWAAIYVTEQRHTLEEIQVLIHSAAGDRYTGTDHDAFAARLAESNPDLRVPYWRDLRAGRVVRDVRIVSDKSE